MEALDSGTGTEGAAAASERILMEIRRRLCSAGYPALRFVDCEYADGTAVLRGRVPTYYYKQLAQSLLLPDLLVKTVVNLIDVADNARTALSPAAAASRRQAAGP